MRPRAKLYYKIARPDGWDFFTGETINYREALTVNGGKGGVEAPSPVETPQLCAPGVLHASRRAEDCFQGGKVPCSLYRVRGIPVVEDSTKAGFRQLSVLEELDPATHFKWRYAEACNPVHPFKLVPPEISPEHLRMLKEGDSVRANVRASVRASVGDSVGYSVGDIVGYSVWNSAWNSVGAYVGASVGASMWASVWAYMGSLFTAVVKDWQGVEHKRVQYPFQPAADLWRQGLVPSYDGELWRLHGGPKAEILWEGRI